MRIIPVIDLKGGVVVRGQGGQRDLYRPIVTPLANGADPERIAAALIAASGSDTLYIADLDAIVDGQPQTRIVSRLMERFPRTTVWLDAGFRSPSDARDHVSRIAPEGAGSRLVPVLGTETLDAAIASPEISAGASVLSLDFGSEGYRGPADILAAPERWPRSVVVMSLPSVGSGRGPDLERLEDIVARAGDRQVHAAGGVRDDGDIAALERIGVAGALVASALHDGRLRIRPAGGGDVGART